MSAKNHTRRTRAGEERGEFAGEGYLTAILDAFPAPVLIADRSLTIVDANPAARNLFARQDDGFSQFLCGEFIQCVNSLHPEHVCGETERCADCLLRHVASTVAAEKQQFRVMTNMTLLTEGKPTAYTFLISGSLFSYNSKELIILTLEDITELAQLRQIIPICSHCGKLRDDRHYWQGVEEYFEKYRNVRFSHGICPDCFVEHYPDFADKQDVSPKKKK